MQHMTVAYAQLGVEETSGPGATPAIIEYFRQAGRADVVSDEVPWCAAFVAACLSQGGCRAEVEKIPKARRLLARAFLDVGTAIDEPRVGAIAVFERPEAGPTSGHVGFVAGSTETHIHVLGGNQGNEVSIRPYPRSRLIGLRWPALPLTSAEIQADGSRTMDRSARARADTVKAAGVELVERSAGINPLDTTELTALAGKAGQFKGATHTLLDFGNFAVANLKWIALAAALYYAGRVVWHQVEIRRARRQDQNEGRLQPAPAAPAHEMGHINDLA